MSITVYSNPSCMPCTMTKKWLTQNGIPYEEKSLPDIPKEQLDMFKDLGFTSAPIVEANGDLWSGYRLDKLRGLLD